MWNSPRVTPISADVLWEVVTCNKTCVFIEDRIHVYNLHHVYDAHVLASGTRFLTHKTCKHDFASPAPVAAADFY